MKNLTINAEGDEVTASGSFGYIFLYLDEKPYMKCRFHKKIRLKLVWDKKVPPLKNNSLSLLRQSLPSEPTQEGKQNVQLHCGASTPVSRQKALKNDKLTSPLLSFHSSSVHGLSKHPLQTNQQSSLTSSELQVGNASIESENNSATDNTYCSDLEVDSDSEKGEIHKENPKHQKCQICQEIFTNQENLLLHHFYSHGFDFVSAHYDGFNYPKSADFVSDLQNYKCPICQEVFSAESILKSHISSIHFQKCAVQCHLCIGIAHSQRKIIDDTKMNHSVTKDQSHKVFVLGSKEKFELSEQFKCFESKKATSNELRPDKNQGMSSEHIKKGKVTKYKNIKGIASSKKRKSTCDTVSANENETCISNSQNSACTNNHNALDKKILWKGMKTCKFCKKLCKSLSSHCRPPSLKIPCPTCKLTFSSEADLIVHQYIKHSIPFPPIAEESNSSFKVDHTLNNSNKQDHIKDSKRKLKCPLCDANIRVCNLVEHLKRHHTKEPVYCCCVCKRPVTNLRALHDHLQTHTGKESRKGKWHCSLCPSIFSSASEFHRHSNTHRTVCVFCHKDLCHLGLLKRHYVSEHKEQLLPCRVCGEGLPTKKQLWTHERHHRYSKPRPCHECGVMVRNLRLHLATCHKNSSEELAAEKLNNCDRNAIGSNEGETVGEQKFVCAICSKSFPTEGWLVRHMARKHKLDLDLKFKCPKCPLMFPDRRNLASHIRRHLKKKNSYVCSVCGKACSEKYNLRIHMRVHALEKCFLCDLCGQGFNYKASLDSHVASKHAGKK